jgi:3-hydroxyisobutyrate dehydrogenase-like beta-hydroxyacid dehydrogenase
MSGKTIGIVGLEPRTSAIARRLATCGWRVLVHDRQAERRAPLAALRPEVEIAGSLADIGGECSDVILWRPNLDTLKDELFGDPDRPGLAHELQPGALIIDLSPGSPQIPPRVQGALGQRAIGVVDAAILAGGPDAAMAGTLDIALGGYVAFVERAEAILAPLGRTRRTGALGSARAARIVSASLRAVLQKALAEAGALGHAAGLSPETVADLVGLAQHGGNSADAAALAIDAATAVALAHELGLKVPLADSVAS